MSKKKKRFLLVLDAVLVVGLIVGLLVYQKKANEKEQRESSEADISRRYVESLQHEGTDYPLNRHLSTVLLIGTDNFVDDDKQNEIEAFYNFNLADFLVLLVFDHSNRTVTPFQICRDTMCDVPWLSVNGLVGGVTVTLEDDIPALGPEYVRGARVTLRGPDSLRFVRYRDLNVLDSNWTRMAHHRIYFAAFMDAVREALADNEDFAVSAFRAVEPFTCTDLSVENVSDLIDRICSYEILPVVTPGGEYVNGDPFAEFLVDETSLWDCVRNTFCQ